MALLRGRHLSQMASLFLQSAPHLSQMVPCAGHPCVSSPSFSDGPLVRRPHSIFFWIAPFSEGAPSALDGALVLAKCAPSVSDCSWCEPSMWLLAHLSEMALRRSELLAITLRWPLPSRVAPWKPLTWRRPTGVSLLEEDFNTIFCIFSTYLGHPPDNEPGSNHLDFREWTGSHTAWIP